MKSRPLKVGEYRKVKTWEQLLATEGVTRDKEGIRFENDAIYFFSTMDYLCGDVVKLYTINKQFSLFEHPSILPIADFFTNDYYDSNGNEIKMEYTWVDDINPLDQLELETKQTLAKITKLREIEAKQAEIDTKIEEQNKRIEEYLK